MSKLATFAIALLIAPAGLRAQGQPLDPWKRIPALPTTCYTDNDFRGSLTNLHAALGDEQRQQDEINMALEQKFGEMDMQEKMQKMMEYMRKDPQKAQKMMQAQQAAASAITSDITDGDDAKKERNAEFAKLSAAFNSEMDAAAKPFRARRDEIMKTSRRVLGEGENWEFTTKAAQDEYNSLIDKENADYEARCATYFGANGKMVAWLASYRETALDPVARATEANDEIKTTQMVILDSPGAGFRSTAQMTAAREYISAVQKAYDLRRPKLKRVER